MSNYVNCGAMIGAEWCASKKVLKESLKAVPDAVLFVPTSMFNDGTMFSANEIRPGMVLSVVGPNPYSNRKWYATVERTASGAVKCS